VLQLALAPAQLALYKQVRRGEGRMKYLMSAASCLKAFLFVDRSNNDPMALYKQVLGALKGGGSNNLLRDSEVTGRGRVSGWIVGSYHVDCWVLPPPQLCCDLSLSLLL
jgi:hypothetical protein